jgi:hypothetical protein
VVAALRRGDVRAARDQLVAHIRASREQALEHFDRQHENPPPMDLGRDDLPRDLAGELERIERAAAEQNPNRDLPLA